MCLCVGGGGKEDSPLFFLSRMSCCVIIHTRVPRSTVSLQRWREKTHAVQKAHPPATTYQSNLCRKCKRDRDAGKSITTNRQRKRDLSVVHADRRVFAATKIKRCESRDDWREREIYRRILHSTSTERPRTYRGFVFTNNNCNHFLWIFSTIILVRKIHPVFPGRATMKVMSVLQSKNRPKMKEKSEKHEPCNHFLWIFSTVILVRKIHPVFPGRATVKVMNVLQSKNRPKIKEKSEKHEPCNHFLWIFSTVILVRKTHPVFPGRRLWKSWVFCSQKIGQKWRKRAKKYAVAVKLAPNFYRWIPIILLTS